MTKKQTMFQSLDKVMMNAQIDYKTSFGNFVRDYRQYRESGANLTFMTRNEFMKIYNDEFEYEGDQLVVDDDLNNSRYQLYFLVDISEEKKHTMNKEMRQKYRKCGKLRRMKLDGKYNYEINVFNRIHAYVIVEHSPGLSDDKTLAINIICSSNYTDIKGVGSYTLKTLIESAKQVGYGQIVLEVGSEEMEEKEEDEESSDEETDEEETDEEFEGIKDDFCLYMAENLWKKSVRHNNSIPYYSFNEDYLESIILDNIENEETESDIPDIVEDEEYGYHGYYYNKAKINSKKLIQYYEKFGFKEDSTIHKELKCFSELPLPSLKLSL